MSNLFRRNFSALADWGGRFKRFLERTAKAENRMKWFFAYAGDSDEGFKKLIKVAVISARKNTNLEPFCIYDGICSDLTIWLEKQGVQIIHHRSRFSERIKEIFGNDLSARGGRGAMLRVEIPQILFEKKIKDKYILYTDCDVMFVGNVENLFFIRPKYFACAPEIDPDNWENFNTGVMLMNVGNLYKTYEEFASFIRKHLKKGWCWDQTAYNLFYKNKNSKLPKEYNWKPYWGDSPKKKIIHFHGLKPSWKRGIIESFKGTENKFLLDLYNKNPDAYKNFFLIWDQFLSEE